MRSSRSFEHSCGRYPGSGCAAIVFWLLSRQQPAVTATELEISKRPVRKGDMTATITVTCGALEAIRRV